MRLDKGSVVNFYGTYLKIHINAELKGLDVDSLSTSRCTKLMRCSVELTELTGGLRELSAPHGGDPY